MTLKSLNLAKESGKYWKVFDDKYVFSDEWYYPSENRCWTCMDFWTYQTGPGMWFFFQYWAGTDIGFLKKNSYQFGTGIKSQADFCMV